MAVSVHGVIAVMCQNPDIGHLRTMTFPVAYKTMQTVMDKERDAALRIASRVDYSSMPTLSVTMLKHEELYKMPCTTDAEALVLVRRALELSNVPERDRMLILKQLDNVIHHRHLPEDVRVQLGFVVHDAEELMFEKDPELLADRGSARQGRANSDDESDSSSDEDAGATMLILGRTSKSSSKRSVVVEVERVPEPDVTASIPEAAKEQVYELVSSLPEPPLGPETVPESSSGVAPVLVEESQTAPTDTVEEDLSVTLVSDQATLADLETVPNELSLQFEDDVEEEAAGFALAPVRPRTTCKLDRIFHWKRTERTQSDDSFAHLHRSWVEKVGLSESEALRMVLLINTPEVLPTSELQGLVNSLKIKEQLILDAELRLPEPSLELLESVLGFKDLKCLSKIPPPDYHHHTAIVPQLILAQILVLPEYHWPESSVTLAHLGAHMLEGSRGHRHRGGNLDGAEEPDGEPSRWQKFRDYVRRQWHQYTSSPNPTPGSEQLAAADLNELGQTLEEQTQEDASSISSGMSQLSDYLQRAGGTLRQNIVSMGHRVRAEIKRITKIMRENTPEAEQEARVALERLKAKVRQLSNNAEATDRVVDEETGILLSKVERGLDTLEEHLEEFIVNTRVSEDMIDSVDVTTAQLDGLQVQVQDLHSDAMPLMQRREMVKQMHSLVNQTRWWLFNGDRRHYKPYQVASFAALLGNLSDSGEVSRVTYVGALDSADVWFAMPEMTPEERYRFQWRMLDLIDTILKNSILSGRSIGDEMDFMERNDQLRSQDIQDVLSFMKYLGTVSNEPFRRSVGRATGGNKDEERRKALEAEQIMKLPSIEKVANGLYDYYDKHLAIKLQSAAKHRSVSMARVVEAFNACCNLLRMHLSEEKMERLRADHRYYRTLLYANHAVLEKYLHLQHLQCLGHRHEDTGSSSDDEARGASSSDEEQSSSDSGGSSSSESDEEHDHRHCKEHGVAGELFLTKHHHHHRDISDDSDGKTWLAQETYSPCLELVGERNYIGFSHKRHADYLAFVHLIQHVRNYHDVAHVYHHLGIDRAILLDALHPHSM